MTDLRPTLRSAILHPLPIAALIVSATILLLAIVGVFRSPYDRCIAELRKIEVPNWDESQKQVDAVTNCARLLGASG